MARLLPLAFITLALLQGSRACAADPVTFRRPADDKNENSEVIRGIAFAPDGRLIAGAFGTFCGMLGEPHPGQTVLWDVTTGQRRATLLGHRDGIGNVAFSQNSKLVATAGYLDGIKLWKTETAKEIASIRAGAVITSIAFSPDGKFLVVGLDTFGIQPEGANNAELYDVITRNLVRRFEGHEGGISTVSFSPSGTLLATSSSDGTARLWNVATGESIATLEDQKLNDTVNEYYERVAKRKIEGMTPSIESVAFSPDGKRIAIAGGMQIARGREYGIGAVTLWDVAMLQPLGVLPEYDCSVQQVQFSVDGKLLATAGRDGYVRLWDAATLRSMGRFRGSAPIAFSPDGKALVSTTHDPVLVVRQLADLMGKGSVGKTEQEPPEKLIGLEQFWSVGYDYLSANFDAYLCPAYDARSRSIFGLHYGQCDVLGLDGKVRRSFPVEPDVNTLRLARLSDTDKSEFIGFKNPWGGPVIAFNSAGKILWQQTGDDAIDDVWTADLDGDGRDEVIVGYNGRGGLCVLDHAGDQRWKNSQLANVWRVTAGDVLGDKKKEVIAPSGENLHIFDADGKSLKELDLAFDPFVVDVVRLAKDAPFDTILVAGSSDSGSSIAAVDGNGKTLWTHRLNGFDGVDSIAACPTRPWAAFYASERSKVTVIDCRDGSIIADAGDIGKMAQVAWATADDGNTPILLIATVRALSAYQVKPSRSDPASENAK